MVKSVYLTDSEKTTLISTEEDIVDSDDSSDDENDLHNMMEAVLVQIYMWTDLVIYIAQSEMFVGVSEPRASTQGVTEIVDILELVLARNLLD
jgi:hypothetical protein